MDNDVRGRGKISQMLVLDEERPMPVLKVSIWPDLHYWDKDRSAMETLLSLRHYPEGKRLTYPWHQYSREQLNSWNDPRRSQLSRTQEIKQPTVSQLQTSNVIFDNEITQPPDNEGTAV